MNKHENKRYRDRGEFRIEEFANPSGETVYRVNGWTMDGARVRQNFKTHDEAVARKQVLETEAANLATAGRTVFTKLTPEQTVEAEVCFARLGDHSMTNAVEYYLDNYREPVTNTKLGEAFNKFIEEKTAANLRPLSIKNLKAKASELLRIHGENWVSGIAVDTVRSLIFKPERGPKARDNYRRALHSFFAWATVQGYCAENPVAKITRITAERQEPRILSPEQTAKLLEAARNFNEGALVPYVAIGVFAGLRPTELARLTWDRIDLADKTITIGADIAKMRSRRIVQMSDNLAAWLSPFASERKPIVGVNWRRDFDHVKEVAGLVRRETAKSETKKPKMKKGRIVQARRYWKKIVPLCWCPDIMRHTAISYHLAEHEHEGKTATWAGNSPDVIQKHYKGLVKEAEAKQFWNIMPPSSGKVVNLKAASKRKRTVKAVAVKAVPAQS